MKRNKPVIADPSCYKMLTELGMHLVPYIESMLKDKAKRLIMRFMIQDNFG